MPVNGIELKEGQKWKTLSGRVATLQDNPGADSYIFRTVYEDGEWNTVTKDGKRWTSDYDSFLRELIYDPEQQVKEKLTMKFNPKLGEKIICNNGEEFICCTLETLISKGFGIYFKSKSDSVIFGMKEDHSEWMYWHNEGYPNDFEWNIREVIPQGMESSADKKEEVKEDVKYKAGQPLYTLQEIEDAWGNSCDDWDDFKNELLKISNPEYKEYLRLKAIYESRLEQGGMMDKLTYTTEHIMELIERIAKEFDTEWNGDPDAYEQACTFNDCAEVIRSFKVEYA